MCVNNAKGGMTCVTITLIKGGVDFLKVNVSAS